MVDSDNPNKKTDIFDQDALIETPKRGAWKIMLPLSLVLLAVIFAAWHLGWHAKAVTAGVLLFAGFSHLLAWLLGIITLLPFIGPLLVKVLSLSIIWLLNAISAAVDSGGDADGGWDGGGSTGASGVSGRGEPGAGRA